MRERDATVHKITPDHAAIVGKSIGRQLRYLNRLRERMERRGFTPGDKLYLDVVKAHNAIHALSVELHYLSVRTGVGR